MNNNPPYLTVEEVLDFCSGAMTPEQLNAIETTTWEDRNKYSRNDWDNIRYYIDQFKISRHYDKLT